MHVRMHVAAVLSVSTHMLQCKFVIDVDMYSTSNHTTVNYCIIGFVMCVCVCARARALFVCLHVCITAINLHKTHTSVSCPSVQ